MNKKRPGELAEKVSVTIPKKTLKALRKYADWRHEGNVSRAIVEAVTELAEHAARDQAAQELFELLGDSEPLTASDRAAIAAEQAGGPRYEPGKARRSRKPKRAA